MKSIVYKNPGEVAVEDRPVPEVAAGEVLVKVAFVGVCGTDLNIYQGAHPRAKAPLVMGHEFSGTIVRGHPTLADGTPVTVYPLLSCGRCGPCLSGAAHVCNTLRLIGIDRDGAMAEYVKVPADKILEIPTDLPLRLGAFIEPLAVGVHAARRSGYRPGDSAVVYGAGPIGLCVAACLRYFGASEVIVVETNPHRLGVAARLGCTTIDAGQEDVCARVKELTGDVNADLAFDCAAHPSVQATLLDVVRVQGTAVVVGSYKKPPAVDLLKLEFKELTILGIRVYERRDFEIATDMLRSRRIDFDLLLTESPPDAAPAVFRDLVAGSNVIKMIFRL
jgi:2-desacetyl-2-hydroxyethyl bacteriochlorophyllide A dehydrogenase